MAQKWIKSLLNLRAYPEYTSSVHLLQTHVSFLLVTDHFVYKIKKPVNMGFLDFTTMDRRRFYCEEEVRLNRRLCPDIYLGVVEIRKTPAGISIDGEGTIIDFAVKMKRLPEGRMLDVLLKENKVSEVDMRRIAATIAAFHQTAEHSPDIDRFGTIESIAYNWQENFLQLQEFTGITISRCQLQHIRSRVDSFMEQNGQLFQDRIDRGFIRECDGDIHTENICLTDTVCIFDCIEFNKRFRCCDTAADLAFLLMDLDYTGHSTLAAFLLDEYLSRTDDQELMALIDFYKTYRAVVRGKVESFKLRESEIPPEEKELARQRARLYFNLARGYLLEHSRQPTLFVTCGMMGSGKSSIARALSLELGLNILVSDAVRKEITAAQNGRNEYGQGIYSETWTEATYRELLHRTEDSLMRGKSVIVDATFRRRSDRAAFRAVAEKHGAAFIIIAVTCPEKVIKSRLIERESQPNPLSDGRWDLFHQQKEAFQPLEDDEGKTIAIDTSSSLLDNIDHLLGALELVPCP